MFFLEPLAFSRGKKSMLKQGFTPGFRPISNQTAHRYMRFIFPYVKFNEILENLPHRPSTDTFQLRGHLFPSADKTRLVSNNDKNSEESGSDSFFFSYQGLCRSILFCHFTYLMKMSFCKSLVKNGSSFPVNIISSVTVDWR